MFLNEELLPKKGWGHSSIEQGIDFSEKTACKNLAIAHHAPNRNDEQLNEHSNNLTNDKVFFAYQGLSHSVWNSIGMKKLDFKSGQYIFKAGDKGKEIFLLCQVILAYSCQQTTQRIQILRLGKMKFLVKWE